MTKLEMFAKVEHASLFYPSVGPGPFTLVKFATMSTGETNKYIKASFKLWPWLWP
jgi:hypothetical protein